MISVTDKAKCCGCGACAAVCPVRCIEMRRDGDGFFYPFANSGKCVGCGKCDKVCPVPVWSKKENIPVPLAAFATKAKDEENRTASSSGGMFSVLAEKTAENGGTVFGAVFAEDFTVRHTSTENADGIAAMRGAKYTESDIRGVFPEVKNKLESGVPVLFSGTPCQTAGLKAYLGRDYDGLLCVGFICNSVASPTVFLDYLHDMEKREKGRAVSVSFRDKSTGWSNYSSSFSVTFGDGRVYRETGENDLFKKALVNRIITRPSCSECAFRKYERAADITLGDFWGVEKTYPELADPKGVSLVIIHSEKGAEALNGVADTVDCQNVDLSLALKSNPAFCVRLEPHIARNMFWAERGKKSVADIIRDCFDPSPKNKIKRHFYSKKGR